MNSYLKLHRKIHADICRYTINVNNIEFNKDRNSLISNLEKIQKTLNNISGVIEDNEPDNYNSFLDEKIVGKLKKRMDYSIHLKPAEVGTLVYEKNNMYIIYYEHKSVTEPLTRVEYHPTLLKVKEHFELYE